MMNTKHFPIFGFICLMLSLYALASASPTFASNNIYVGRSAPSLDGEPVTIQLFLDGVPLNLTEQPLRLNEDVFVPAESLFNVLGIQAYWFEESGELVGYRDNTFIKFKMNDDIAYVNGSATPLSIPSSMRYGEQFVSLNAIVNAFGLTYSYDDVLHTISLDFRENVYQYKQVGFRQYKKITTSNWGISYFIPEYWEALEDTYGAYGVQNDFETYTITPTVLPLDSNYNRNILTTTLQNNMKYTYGKNIDFGDQTLSVYNSFLCNRTPYDITVDGIAYKGILYVFFENNIGYVFDCRYDVKNSIYEGSSIFDSVMSTFLISKVTIDQNAEHYIELSKFFDYQVHLTSDLYSNMLSDSHFHFEGTVNRNPNNVLQGYHVIVSKGDESAEYYAPIISGAFSADIPLPFGVGKHNISIYADEVGAASNTTTTSNLTIDEVINEAIGSGRSLNASDLVLRFSIINTSDEDLLYLLPSSYINFNTNDVYSIANSITFDQTSDYGKAKALYLWVLKNYDYASTQDQSITTARDMLTKRIGNDFELSLVYTGLLRALDIPARMVRGTLEDTSHFWVEAYINGKWIVTDVTWDILTNNQPGQQMYFDMGSAIHSEQYEKTELLPF